MQLTVENFMSPAGGKDAENCPRLPEPFRIRQENHWAYA